MIEQLSMLPTLAEDEKVEELEAGGNMIELIQLGGVFVAAVYLYFIFKIDKE